MKRLVAIMAALAFVSAVESTRVHAQMGAGVGAAAKALAPTGPTSATTSVAATIRASRAVAAATRQASGVAATGGGSRTSAVMGYLWTANNSPVSNATVQLRNTVTGEVEMYTKTNAYGEYLFNNLDTGSYVIEYTNNAVAETAQTAVGAASKATDNIVALSQPFKIVEPGQVIPTFVRTVNNVAIVIPDVSSNVAATAVQTAATAGVTTIVAPNVPQEPTASPVR